MDGGGEVSDLKRRFLESRQRGKTMKHMMKEQKERSRQIITAFAIKLQEKEEEIRSVRFLLLKYNLIKQYWF